MKVVLDSKSRVKCLEYRIHCKNYPEAERLWKAATDIHVLWPGYAHEIPVSWVYPGKPHLWLLLSLQETWEDQNKQVALLYGVKRIAGQTKQQVESREKLGWHERGGSHLSRYQCYNGKYTWRKRCCLGNNKTRAAGSRKKCLWTMKTLVRWSSQPYTNLDWP